MDALFLAVSIADRYLVQTAVDDIEAPSLLTLAVTSILMAAKLEQKVTPSFQMMTDYLNEKHDQCLSTMDLTELEEKILRTLDFHIETVSSIDFLARYLRLFGIDQEEKDIRAFRIATLARNHC